jgi:hypothetical protein
MTRPGALTAATNYYRAHLQDPGAEQETFESERPDREVIEIMQYDGQNQRIDAHAVLHVLLVLCSRGLASKRSKHKQP